MKRTKEQLRASVIKSIKAQKRPRTVMEIAASLGEDAARVYPIVNSLRRYGQITATTQPVRYAAIKEG